MQESEDEFDDLIDITAEQLSYNVQRMDHLLILLGEYTNKQEGPENGPSPENN